MSEEIKNQEIIDNACIDMPTETSAISLDCERKNMRRAVSRCGWAVFIATATSFLWSFLLTYDILHGININNYLYFNELFVGVSFLVGSLALVGMPKKRPERKPIKIKSILALFCVCATIGTAGNIIGNLILSVWNFVTGGSAANPLNDVVMYSSPISMIICMGVLAPLLEELFFRKLLIDRLYPYGETTAILVSAVAFGLFHQNFSQFFYAFGIGVLLAYLYCKSGSYKAVVLLHMAFNFVMGVIPAILSKDVLTFYEELEALSESVSFEQMLPLLTAYALPLLLYMCYLAVNCGLNVTGVIVFCTNFKKISIEKTESELTLRERLVAVTVNVGVIAAVLLLTVMMFLSLVTV